MVNVSAVLIVVAVPVKIRKAVLPVVLVAVNKRKKLTCAFRRAGYFYFTDLVIE